MAKLESFKCPHCGAPVDVPQGAAQIVCPYCQHASNVAQARPPTDHPGQPRPVVQIEITGGVPPKVPKAFGLIFLIPILGALVGMGTAGIAVFNAFSSSGVSKAMSSIPMAGALTSVSFGDYPFLFDVNGDGTPDILGKSGSPGGPDWIAAYNGRDGKQLWRTDDLTKDATDGSAMRALAGSTLLSIDGLGKVQAYNAKTGQPAWATLLGETARSACEGDGFVRITTNDKATHDIALATGQKSTTTANAPCRSIGNGRSDDGPGYRMVGWSEFKKHGLPSLHDVDELSAHRALVLDDGKRGYLLGSRSKGSQVAMVAAVEGKKVLWKTLVPGVDPLTTTVNVTTQIAAVSKSRLVVPYNLKGSNGVRMAAFDTQTGTRLWDVPVHDKSQVQTGIVATENDVYYATWTAVYVMEADTGKVRFRVGREF